MFSLFNSEEPPPSFCVSCGAEALFVLWHMKRLCVLIKVNFLVKETQMGFAGLFFTSLLVHSRLKPLRLWRRWVQ